MDIYNSIYSYKYILFIYIYIFCCILNFYTYKNIKNVESTPELTSFNKKIKKKDIFYEKKNYIEYYNVNEELNQKIKKLIYYKEFKNIDAVSTPILFDFIRHPITSSSASYPESPSASYPEPISESLSTYYIECKGRFSHPFSIYKIEVYINNKCIFDIPLSHIEIDIRFDIIQFKDEKAKIYFHFISNEKKDSIKIEYFFIKIYQKMDLNVNHYNSILLIYDKNPIKETYIPIFYDSILIL